MKFYDLSLIIVLSAVAIAAVASVISVKYLGEGNEVEKVADEIITDEVPGLESKLQENK
jgi:hypothetical protein